jgi:hypothetical protein
MNYKIRKTQWHVVPAGMALCDKFVTRVEVVDEADGEFVEVSQEDGKLRFDPEEWSVVQEAIARAFASIQDEGEQADAS